MADSESQPKREGIVNLWRSARTMQIWQEVDVTPELRLREIGHELTVRYISGNNELTRWQAPREWFEEHGQGGGILVCGVIAVPKQELRDALDRLAEKRPKLIAQASREAAKSQLIIEQEQSQQPDRLAMASEIGQNPFPHSTQT